MNDWKSAEDILEEKKK